MDTARELDQWVKKMKCSGATGLDITSFPEIKVGLDFSPVDPGSPSLDPLPEGIPPNAMPAEHRESRWHGELDVEGCKVCGNFQAGAREGRCRVTPAPGGRIAWLEGDYRGDRLEGRAKVAFNDGEKLDGFFKEGVLHGFARFFDRKGRLRLLGHHRNGVMVGTCWKINRGGGCLVGRVDKQGALTGQKIAYIYPDFYSALIGVFVDGVMKEAQECVAYSAVTDDLGIKCPVFSDPSGPLHRRQISDFDVICTDPRVPDPYESRLVEVRSSEIEGGNEGLFAKRFLEVNTTISFYNGIRARPEDFNPDTWETNNYKIFDPANMPMGTIDIPVWAQSSSAYHASLAHKTNHSFLPNGQFVVFDHPKFGLIPCISTIADIEEGEEILVGYGYDMEESPEWYKVAWKNSIFGQEGIEYKDWLECTVRKPISAQCANRS